MTLLRTTVGAGMTIVFNHHNTIHVVCSPPFVATTSAAMGPAMISAFRPRTVQPSLAPILPLANGLTVVTTATATAASTNTITITIIFTTIFIAAASATTTTTTTIITTTTTTTIIITVTVTITTITVTTISSSSSSSLRAS